MNNSKKFFSIFVAIGLLSITGCTSKVKPISQPDSPSSNSINSTNPSENVSSNKDSEDKGSSSISSTISEDKTSTTSQIKDSTTSISSNTASNISSEKQNSTSSTTSSDIGGGGGKTSISLDIYAINDMHGNVKDTTNSIGIEKTSTYLKAKKQANPDTIFLSTGDMWQGSSESNNTKGLLVTDWMNDVGFSSMTLGNHEFDWEDTKIKENAQKANFPMLGINVYDKTTNARADYLKASTMVNMDGFKIGIIGAIGNCYSSISSSLVSNYTFLKGDDLTNLVKAESESLKEQGADFIIYTIHDGYRQYAYSEGSAYTLSDSEISSYYDVSLSKNYVDIVFEGHTHCNTLYQDSKGVYHFQTSGNNKYISHAKVNLNGITNSYTVSNYSLPALYSLTSLANDPYATSLFEKYKDQIGDVNAVIGYNDSIRYSAELNQLIAQLYLERGLEKWSSYNIFLGGGYIQCRSPSQLLAGEVTRAQVDALFPFTNRIVLCSILGSDLNRAFINTTSTAYYTEYSSYGSANKTKVNDNETYYIISDTYSSDYAANKLTVIDYYDQSTYAQDLLADYIREGNLGGKVEETPTDSISNIYIDTLISNNIMTYSTTQSTSKETYTLNDGNVVINANSKSKFGIRNASTGGYVYYTTSSVTLIQFLQLSSGSSIVITLDKTSDVSFYVCQTGVGKTRSMVLTDSEGNTQSDCPQSPDTVDNGIPVTFTNLAAGTYTITFEESGTSLPMNLYGLTIKSK